MYDLWIKALQITDGKRQLTRDELKQIGVSEDIGAGFFRKRTVPRGPFLSAVAIWQMDGDWRASCDGVEVSPEEVWLSAVKWPIHESTWREHALTGEWPEAETV